MASGTHDQNGSEGLGASYGSGYGKPPEAHRFKRGLSGNPCGRPRKARLVVPAPPDTVRESIKAAGTRPVTVLENNRRVPMSTTDAVLRSTNVSAVKGNPRAQALSMKLRAEVEQREREELTLLHTEVLRYHRKCEEECQRCDRESRPRRERIPHPRELRILRSNGAVIYNGPSDAAAAATWDKLLKIRQDARDDIARMERDWRWSEAHREVVDEQIAQQQLIVDVIHALLPDQETRREPDFNIHVWRLDGLKSFYALAAQVNQLRKTNTPRAG